MNDFYKTIPGENMFDFEEYYSSVAERLPDGCRIAEVGNADGRSAIFLAERLHSIGKKFRLDMVDSMDYGGQAQFETLYRNIQGSGLADSIFLHWKDSLAASCKFPDQYFDFVFLDSSHAYEETKAELLLWSRKVKNAGGILAGHDYFSDEHPGVYQAVAEIIQNFTPAVFHQSMHLDSFQTRNGLGVWQISFS